MEIRNPAAFLRFIARKYGRIGFEDDYQLAWVAYLQAKEIVARKGCDLATTLKYQFFKLQKKYSRKQEVGVEDVEVDTDFSAVDKKCDVETMLSSCKPYSRELLERRYLHGESIEEIAKHFKKTEAAIYLTVDKARKRLRERYGQYVK